MRFPNVVAHADWSTDPLKQWLATAELKSDGSYVIRQPKLVDNPGKLLSRLIKRAGRAGTVLVGFDFPIGLPLKFARRADIRLYKTALHSLGSGMSIDFFRVCELAEEISIYRPFYPQKYVPGVEMAHLVEGLDMESNQELYRRCELAISGGLYAASPMFWTLGPKQVGRAAISGWPLVLQPALNDKAFDVTIWPFDGPLKDLLSSSRIVIAETWPTVFGWQLGLAPGKSDQGIRKSNGSKILSRRSPNLRFDRDTTEVMDDGFGPSSVGEDRFDALVGLVGMINVLFEEMPSGDPIDPEIRDIESWILGRPSEWSQV
jgi:hypothetical protein